LVAVPIAHGLWDPDLIGDYTIVLSSGAYHWLYTVGFHNIFQVFSFVILLELLALVSLSLGQVHLLYHEDLFHWLNISAAASTSSGNSGLFHKNSGLNIKLLTAASIDNLSNFGILSALWCGHLVDYAIPVSNSIQSSASSYPFSVAFTLTFLGGFQSNTLVFNRYSTSSSSCCNSLCLVKSYCNSFFTQSSFRFY
jgi:hypothetical protein